MVGWVVGVRLWQYMWSQGINQFQAPPQITKSMRTVLGRNMTLVYVLTTQYPQFTIQAINRHASGKKKLYLISLLI